MRYPTQYPKEQLREIVQSDVGAMAAIDSDARLLVSMLGKAFNTTTYDDIVDEKKLRESLVDLFARAAYAERMIDSDDYAMVTIDAMQKEAVDRCGGRAKLIQLFRNAFKKAGFCRGRKLR